MNKEVMKLSDLCELYIEHLCQTPFPNPKYRSEKLKSKLTNHEVYGSKLCFVELDRQGEKFQSYLAFSCDLDLPSAVKNGYLLECSEEVLSYPLMPVPSSLGTADGYLLKNRQKQRFSSFDQGCEGRYYTTRSVCNVY